MADELAQARDSDVGRRQYARGNWVRGEVKLGLEGNHIPGVCII